MKTNTSTGLLILRLTIGTLLLVHGVSKLYNGVGWISDMLGSPGHISPVAYLVFMGELFATVLLICGFRTKIAAMLIIINMCAAIFLVHRNEIFTFSENGGWGIELPALFLFGAITLFFAGGGEYAASNESNWD
ncbi:MAG TPA: DoxX family protein [Chitinophagales bacterium]|nr:DoxX family protein [Chitinophagales bacterium]HMU98551.1 DoxX family protein [Chitinophagales bacterium]HMV02805.1 DoxX family protein [Chitinophagales bacterium]HMW94863.1 DoxX family protein [Chitinophagales bacterium]HMY41744.1 DoxX family protein [Chitinophagales bacterium]